MAHLSAEKDKLITRVRKIRGQVDAIEKALDEDRDCTSTLQMIAACRGAMNGLMARVLEGHVREHVLDPKRKISAEQKRATDELLSIIKTYLK